MKNKRRFLILLISLLIFTNLVIMGNRVLAIEENQRIRIVVTTNILKEFTQRIGGDKVEVVNIIPANVRVQDFEMKINDYEKLFKCKLFIYNGLGLEPWYDGTLKQNVSDYSIRPILSTMNVNSIGNKNNKNPYAWLSLTEAKKQALEIKNGLVKYDAQNTSFYEENYNLLITELDVLINEYTTKFKGVTSKEFITGHNFFEYLARDFGLVNSSVLKNNEILPSANISEEIVKYCKDKNIKVIFEEASQSEQGVSELASKINGRVEKLYILDNSAETMSYMEAMKYNLETIYNGLL